MELRNIVVAVGHCETIQLRKCNDRFGEDLSVHLEEIHKIVEIMGAPVHDGKLR
jgi:hypothetical protein